MKGVSILTVTPLDERARVSEPDLVSLFKFVLKPGVDSLTVCGEMGEGPSLTDEDKVRVIKLAKQACPTVIAAVFALSTREALAQIELAGKAGADYIMLAPVATFPYSPRAVKRFFADCAKPGVPLLAYLNKMFKPPAPDVTKAAWEVDGVAGMKDSTGDLELIKRLISERPKGKAVIHTVSSNALAGVQAGADGLMVGTSNLAPDAAVAIFKDRSAAAQERLMKAAALYKIAPEAGSKDWVVVKEALAQMGVIRSEGRYPASPYELLGEEDRRKVGQMLPEFVK